VSDSTGDQQPRPPQTFRSPGLGLLAVALIGALVGLIGQEVRWRGSVPQGQLAQGERAFQAGDNQAAIALFGSLADKNNASAQYWLAHMTELGLGMPRDPAKAVELYKKAAGQGLDAAELRLGEIYLDGDLVTPDFAEAKIYLEKSAYQGDAHAAMLLGQMYRIGLGVTAQPTEAYAWSEVGALEGNALAKRERDAALRKLSAADQISAIARAGEILKTIKNETNPVKSQTSASNEDKKADPR
jgi:TPR repeat protein